MIKFEVGKIYRCNGVLGDREMFKVLKRNDKNLWTVFVTEDGREYDLDFTYRKIKTTDWLHGDENYEYVTFPVGIPGLTFNATNIVDNYDEIVENAKKKEEKKKAEKEARIQAQAEELKNFLKENNITLEFAEKIENGMRMFSSNVIEAVREESRND